MDAELRPPLVRAFPDSPKMRILGSLVEADRPLQSSEIAAHGGVSQSTVNRHIDRLLEAELVERQGNASTLTYRLADSDQATDLQDLNRHLEPAVGSTSDQQSVREFVR